MDTSNPILKRGAASATGKSPISRSTSDEPTLAALLLAITSIGDTLNTHIADTAAQFEALNAQQVATPRPTPVPRPTSPEPEPMTTRDKAKTKKSKKRSTLFGPRIRKSLVDDDEEDDNSSEESGGVTYQVPKKMVVANLEEFKFDVKDCTVDTILRLEEASQAYHAKNARQVNFRDYIPQKLRRELITMYVTKDEPEFSDNDWYDLPNRRIKELMLAKAMPQTQTSWIKTWRATCKFEYPMYPVTLGRFDILASHLLQYITLCKKCYALIKDARQTSSAMNSEFFFADKRDGPRLCRPALLKKAQDFSGTKSDVDSLVGLFLAQLPSQFASHVHRNIFPDGAKLAGSQDNSFEEYLALWQHYIRNTNLECINLRPAFESLLLFNEAVNKRSEEGGRRSMSAISVQHANNLDGDDDSTDEQVGVAAFQPRPPPASHQSVGPPAAPNPNTKGKYGADSPKGCCWARLRGLPCKLNPCPYDHSLECAKREVATLQNQTLHWDSKPVVKLIKSTPDWVSKVKPRLASVEIEEKRQLSPEDALLAVDDPEDCDQAEHTDSA